jgi:hypothetical protein
MQATATTWTPSRSDMARAQHKATEVLHSIATPDAIFDASQAMLDAGSDHTAGYRAYYLSLHASADQDGQDAAREAWTGALAESEERHAQRHAEAEADDQDDDTEADESATLL